MSSQTLVTSLLDFIRRKFYSEGAGPEGPVIFAKDRPRLLKWVVLWPAGWLHSRGVTLPPERYRQILESVLMDALRFGQSAEKITYLPAYLKMVLQSHFAHHGEEYYEEAKTLRAALDRTLLTYGQVASQRPDPLQDLAAAARLLKPSKLARKSPVKDQLTLL
jgi:hypothetical protein